MKMQEYIVSRMPSSTITRSPQARADTKAVGGAISVVALLLLVYLGKHSNWQANRQLLLQFATDYLDPDYCRLVGDVCVIIGQRATMCRECAKVDMSGRQSGVLPVAKSLFLFLYLSLRPSFIGGVSQLTHSTTKAR